jgi:hypothetical protein
MGVSFGETSVGGIIPTSTIRVFFLIIIVLFITFQMLIMRAFFHCDSILSQQEQEQLQQQRQQKQKQKQKQQHPNEIYSNQHKLMSSISELQNETQTFQDDGSTVTPNVATRTATMTTIPKPIQQPQNPLSLDKSSIKVPSADGTFNGYPIYLRQSSTSKVTSSTHCVGDNFREDAWIHRSCQFRHLCFDTMEREFVVFRSTNNIGVQGSPTTKFSTSESSSSSTSSSANNNQTRESNTISIQELPSNYDSSLLYSSSSLFTMSNNMMNAHVSIGGINTKWTWSRGVPRLRWFPRIKSGPIEGEYYELDKHVVMIPFHSFFAQNPGSYNHQPTSKHDILTHSSLLLCIRTFGLG